MIERPISATLAQLVEEPLTIAECELLGLPKELLGKPRAQALAYRLISNALGGDPASAQIVLDSVEGSPIRRIAITDSHGNDLCDIDGLRRYLADSVEARRFS